MLFDEAVRLIRAHVESKFPKACRTCGRVFLDLSDYLRRTRYVGNPVSYDADLEDWTPREPIGAYAMSLCPCGTSLAIDSSGMSLLMLWRLMRFVRDESLRRGVTLSEILVGIRVEVRRQVLAERSHAGEPGSAEDEAVLIGR